MPTIMSRIFDKPQPRMLCDFRHFQARDGKLLTTDHSPKPQADPPTFMIAIAMVMFLSGVALAGCVFCLCVALILDAQDGALFFLQGSLLSLVTFSASLLVVLGWNLFFSRK
jgi:hypothetical protein